MKKILFSYIYFHFLPESLTFCLCLSVYFFISLSLSFFLSLSLHVLQMLKFKLNKPIFYSCQQNENFCCPIK